MISYYLFMALLITTLVLWAIVAIRDESPEDREAPPEKKDEEA